MYEDFLDEMSCGWVVEIDDKIVAFCYADKANAFILALFVRPGYEGRGFGQSLLKQSVDWLFGIGHKCAYLTTGLNTRADRFYSEQGRVRAPVSSMEVGYSLTKPRTVE
ncbi:GNAT family N-acetyltransferase [Pseudoduganella dura]